MKKRFNYYNTLFMLIFLFCVSSNLFADYSMSVFKVLTEHDTEQKLESRFGEGFHLGMELSDSWSLEMAYEEDNKLSSGEHIDYSRFGINFHYRLYDFFHPIVSDEPSNLIPSWKFGVFHEEINPLTEGTQGDTLLRFGPGVNLPISTRWHLNLNAIADYHLEESFMDYSIYAGFEYFFEKNTKPFKTAIKKIPSHSSKNQLLVHKNNQPQTMINSSLTHQKGTDSSLPPKPVAPEQSHYDNDNDGISNTIDKCPSTHKNVIVNSHGCEIYDRDEIIVFKKSLQLSQQQTLLLNQFSQQQLEQLQIFHSILTNDKEGILIVEGYANQQEVNSMRDLTQSSKRTQRVIEWFVKKGISRNRIQGIGRGFKQSHAQVELTITTTQSILKRFL